MKCLYCAEEHIKDEATVCLHCGRGLLRYKLSLLQKEVREIRSSLESLQSQQAQEPYAAQRRPTILTFLPDPKDKLPFWQHALDVLLSAVLVL